jgi:hypothetical protein
MAGHDRMHDTMFWVGALFALTPIVIGLVVAGVLWHQRRKHRPPSPPTHD